VLFNAANTVSRTKRPCRLVRDEEAVRPHASLSARGQAIWRPKALDNSESALAQRMHAGGESASTVANALGVSRAVVSRVLAETGRRKRLAQRQWFGV
jgi:hypothetical protein